MVLDRECNIISPESLLPETARSPRRAVSFNDPRVQLAAVQDRGVNL